MFIWTISDVIGLALFAIVVVFSGVLLSIIWIQDWIQKRRRRGHQ